MAMKAAPTRKRDHKRAEHGKHKYAQRGEILAENDIRHADRDGKEQLIGLQLFLFAEQTHRQDRRKERQTDQKQVENRLDVGGAFFNVHEVKAEVHDQNQHAAEHIADRRCVESAQIAFVDCKHRALSFLLWRPI